MGCLTAASVGFSSWVIAAQDTYDTSNVKVTVANIEDHRFKVKAFSDSTIKLGPNEQGQYISYSESAPEEALDFKFSLTFTAKGSTDAFNFTSLGDHSFNINFSFTDTLNINDAKNEYIKFPSGAIGTISNSGFTPKISGAATDPQSSNVITYNGALAWGSHFDNDNPSKLNDPNKVDSYIEGLKHLKECLKDNAAFKIKVNIDKAV